MTFNLKAGAGDVMRDILKRMCKNRLLGMFTGILVTAVLSSSSAASVMLVTFVESGYITFEESIGALLGVNIGTTITVYLVALNITKYCLAMVACGYAIFSFSAKGSQSSYLGEALFGLGLLFFGIDIMGESMSPLRHYQPFLDVLMSLDNIWTAIIASTVFTLVIQSSAAVLSIVVVLAQQGFLSQRAGVAMVLGANIGTTGTALLSSFGKQKEAVRVAVAYVVLKAIGVIAIAPVVSWFIYLIYALEGAEFVTPVTKAERAEHVPGIVTAAHSLFNVLLALVFLPFTPAVAFVVETLVPNSVEAVKNKRLANPDALSCVLQPTPTLSKSRTEIQQVAKTD
mmetsp:Transcript_10758/g.14952  ORF Transcript_10758/g.14952 Transcript_10758/m.14952 type:complete len:342 (-) Transcript_10758:338-1363(-)